MTVHEKDIDRAWQMMTALVVDNRDTWRRQVAAEVGIPFSRIRVLRRLLPGSLTMRELATAAAMDAPATTVCVNDLEARGYVRRTVEEGNRRCKRVTVTDAGRAVMDAVATVTDPAPEALRRLSDDDAADLVRLLSRVRADAVPDRS